MIGRAVAAGETALVRHDPSATGPEFDDAVVRTRRPRRPRQRKRADRTTSSDG